MCYYKYLRRRLIIFKSSSHSFISLNFHGIDLFVCMLFPLSCKNTNATLKCSIYKLGISRFMFCLAKSLFKISSKFKGNKIKPQNRHKKMKRFCFILYLFYGVFFPLQVQSVISRVCLLVLINLRKLSPWSWNLNSWRWPLIISISLWCWCEWIFIGKCCSTLRNQAATNGTP